MNITKAQNLACPIDGNKLEQSIKQFVCENDHAYDIAKQGYVNLLPVQHKRSKQPGDSKAMVLARTAFLDSGIYSPIADMLTKVVSEQIADKRDTCLLDAGCGEGYYFDQLFKKLQDAEGSNNVSFVGLDISKDAVIQATKRNKKISWVVGTNRQPPVEENSVDIILCLFGFVCVDGFTHVLKPGGKIILVDPGANHLKELREIIYPELKKSEDSSFTDLEIPGCSLISQKSILFKEKISGNEAINNLLIMTPHFYRASREGREIACALQTLDITIDVIFRVFELPVLEQE